MASVMRCRASAGQESGPFSWYVMRPENGQPSSPPSSPAPPVPPAPPVLLASPLLEPPVSPVAPPQPATPWGRLPPVPDGAPPLPAPSPPVALGSPPPLSCAGPHATTAAEAPSRLARAPSRRTNERPSEHRVRMAPGYHEASTLRPSATTRLHHSALTTAAGGSHDSASSIARWLHGNFAPSSQ